MTSVDGLTLTALDHEVDEVFAQERSCENLQGCSRPAVWLLLRDCCDTEYLSCQQCRVAMDYRLAMGVPQCDICGADGIKPRWEPIR